MDFIKNIANLQALNFMRHTNLSVGIFGGTFNPVHHGHLMISLTALNQYKFDYIIWVVANQNPFKPPNKVNIFDRAQQAIKLSNHPKIIISTAEYELGCSQTYNVLKAFTRRFPLVKFFWLMGMDNISHFAKWNNYKELIKLCDVIIFDRPVSTRLVNIRSFRLNTKKQVNEDVKSNINVHRGKLYNISSTQIRSNLQI